MDLVTFITKSECESLNEADDHPLAHCLTSSGGYLASDVDEQLIINISFNQVYQSFKHLLLHLKVYSTGVSKEIIDLTIANLVMANCSVN